MQAISLAQIGRNKHLGIDEFVQVSRQRKPVEFGPHERHHVHLRRKELDQKLHSSATDQGIYGINTGFGSLAKCVLPPEQGQQLSRNIITSHSVGSGSPFDEEVVRGAMLHRSHSLAQGFSGVHEETVSIYIDALNEGLYPFVPSQGSLGACGDLAPLSHLALALTRATSPDIDDDAGQFLFPGAAQRDSCQICRNSESSKNTRGLLGHHTDSQSRLWHPHTAKEVLGNRRVVLDSKEGLALNNGTSMSLSLAAHAVYDMETLLHHHAPCAIALALEAAHAVRDPFLPQLHQLRPHEGAQLFSKEIMSLLHGSRCIDPGDADYDPARKPPQDPYSMRCTPAAFAAFWAALNYAKEAVTTELNSVTDNPLFLGGSDSIRIARDYSVVSGGHFHGDPIAIPMDSLKIASCKLASLCERLIFKLTDFTSRGIPPMILAVPESEHGLNSGFMIVQYTAAALVNECSVLSHPSSVHSIPTSANQEDYVSMSMNAARNCRTVIANTERVVAMLLLSAAQAIDAQAIDPSFLAPRTRAVYDSVRSVASMMKNDRVLYDDMEAVVQLIRHRNDLSANTGVETALV